MASSNYQRLVKYLDDNYDQDYISRYARRLNGWHQGMNGSQERDHIAKCLDRGSWTPQMLQDQRNGRSRADGLVSPSRYNGYTSPSRNNGYVSPSRRNGYVSPSRVNGGVSPSRMNGGVSPTRYNGGSVQNYSGGRGGEAAGTHQAPGYQPGKELTTADVSRALSPSRRNGGMVQNYRYDDNGSLRGDRSGYGYGGRGESSYARRGMDMPPKTASSGERLYQGTMGPGDSSIDGAPDVVPQPQRYRPLVDLNGQPDERGHYDRQGEYEGVAGENPNAIFTQHKGGRHRGSSTHGLQEAKARAEDVAQEALARAMQSTSGGRRY